MIAVNIYELAKLKELPYDLFTRDGKLIMSLGESLSPGKLLRLRQLNLYRNLASNTPGITYQSGAIACISKTVQEHKVNRGQNTALAKSLQIKAVNKDCLLSPQKQVEIKVITHKIIDKMAQGVLPDPQSYYSVRDIILNEVLEYVEKVKFLNELRVYDSYNYAHGLNVSILSSVLCHKLGFNRDQTSNIALGAVLLDIGKTRIPDKIMNKSTALTKQDYDIIKLHTTLGYKIILEELKLPQTIAEIALYHHERYDGTGYPYGIKGDNIELGHQVVALADVYDALISDKSYSQALTTNKALEIMERYVDKWYSRSLFDTFKSINLATEGE